MDKDGKTFNRDQYILSRLLNRGDLQINSIVHYNMQFTQILVLCTLLFYM